ncbi:hypothetical protein ACFVAG_07425 [Streptomyces sp. NPDC057644]
MDELLLSANDPAPFWPTGAIIITAITAITVITLSIGIWRNRRMRQGKDY